MADLAASYALCCRAARRTATNFYYAFLLLPRQQRRSMCALYAFLRHTDDIVDNPRPLPARRAALERWRGSLDRALSGEFDDPMLPALADTLVHYRIPPVHLYDVLDGVEMDLDNRHYATFDELRLYCQRVASAVGLACLPIWNCRHPEASRPAIACGIAFQLTNILRDLREDLDRGRVYLPRADLERFGCDVETLGGGRADPHFRAMMRYEIERAESFYREAEPLVGYLDSQARTVLATMMSTYRALLNEIKRRDGDVLTSRVRLGRWHRWQIAARSYLAHSRTTAWFRGARRG